MKLSPSVRGMRGFISAMTALADCAVGFVIPTSMPKEQKPCSSGGETCTSATSSASRPLLKSLGTSLRNTGVKSARPSFTAARTLSLMNSVFTRRCPAISGAT